MHSITDRGFIGPCRHHKSSMQNGSLKVSWQIKSTGSCTVTLNIRTTVPPMKQAHLITASTGIHTRYTTDLESGQGACLLNHVSLPRRVASSNEKPRTEIITNQTVTTNRSYTSVVTNTPKLFTLEGIITVNTSRGGANASSADDFGWIPLHYAVKARYTNLVELLLEYGANAAARDAERKTPWYLAAEMGQMMLSSKP
jgi:hypothetical protein